jgi:hypothetical protein
MKYAMSTALVLMALSGIAQAGPGLPDKDYWLNEAQDARVEGASDQSAANRGTKCDNPYIGDWVYGRPRDGSSC